MHLNLFFNGVSVVGDRLKDISSENIDHFIEKYYVETEED